MSNRKFSWQSNFIKIPKHILTDLEGIETDHIVVSAVKTVPVADIAAGLYSHLGIEYDLLEEEVTVMGDIEPPAWAGKWSYRNANGWDRKRLDLPKVPKTFVWETPNFGDAATYGTHDHFQTRMVYQNQVFEPQGMTIRPEILSQGTGEKAILRFTVSPFLKRDQPEFHLMLLWKLNVLQENCGAVGIYRSDATDADYLKNIQLDWEVFPSGNADQVVEWFLSKYPKNRSNPEFEFHIKERTLLFGKLKPEMFIKGSSKFGSYFGAKFADDLVVFENVKYGNALYILYENWEEISKRSRLDLLRDQDSKFDRIVHKENWKMQFDTLLKQELAARRRGRGRRG